jgi:hypothetical protein
MFARYLLGDLFLHGIGGAKYDELGDEISGRFFGSEPPAFMTVSMTLWPGLRHDATAPGRLTAVERELRDLTYNPDRHLDCTAGAEASALVDAKRQALLAPVATHAQRRARFREIRRCNQALQDAVAGRFEALMRVREGLRDEARRGASARSRAYPFVLYPRRRLREALQRALPGLALGGS